ncbi:spore coat protein GerQ [Solibacillus daqui]|uniref:spore coat protein GerQ n=1 Tax=Solibacillus daqui TaxID=2912187 RepID=UPI0030833019
MPQMTPSGIPMQTTVPGASFPREESYIENILRLNKGKPGTFYFSFDNAVAGTNTRTVRGVVEAAGRDHVILRELKSNHRFLFPMIYFDYAEFDEELNYFTQSP